MSDPFLQQQLNNAQNVDQAPGSDRRRLERMQDSYGSAQAGGGTDWTVWTCRLVAGFIIVAGIATAIAMAKESPLWVAVVVGVGALVGGIALLQWGEKAPERRRRAHLQGKR